MWTCALALSLGLGAVAKAADVVVSVEASEETDPVALPGDAADDLAIWIHADDPALSTLITVDKLSGLVVYDLSGQQLQLVPGGRKNNVDLRYQFPLDGEKVSIVAVSERDTDEILLFTVDEATGLLDPDEVGAIGLTFEPYGLCLYVSPVDQQHYAFVNAKNGTVQQWLLTDDGQGGVQGTMVRGFAVATQPEGCVADDKAGWFFIGEEAVGIWRYGAEPGDGSTRIQVDATSGEGSHLTADVEGLTIYYGSGSHGYLLASSQGSNSYVAYDRAPPHDYEMTFEIVAGTSIDGTSTTDGIDVTNAPLGAGFPLGLFVAQDDSNNGQNQNFKLVPWQEIAIAVDPALEISTGHDPREVGKLEIFADDFELGEPTGWTEAFGL